MTTPVSAPKIEAETDVKIEPSVKVDMSSDELQMVFSETKNKLTSDVLKDILSKMNAISEKCTGDGAGLMSGALIDMFLTEILSSYIESFKEERKGECDCKILGIPLSLKKISGKSNIALDWSKNSENSVKRERFNADIIIINIKTEQWWKEKPYDCTQEEIDSKFYLTPINAGIYFIPKMYCKKNITLSSNNKTNSLINQKSLYRMIKESIKNNMVIEFPSEVLKYEFNILNAFSYELSKC